MNSRRKIGARRYKDYEGSLLEVAVDLVRNKNISSYEAEKQFGIPRRTIINKIKQKHCNKVGSPFRLSQEDENKIVSALIICGEYGSPLTLQELRLIVYDYLVKDNKAYLFNNKVPGEKWARNFVKRHRSQLTIRSTQNIKRARALKTVEEYQEYFDNLKLSLQGIKPQYIVNYDETNLSDNPGNQKCIFKRGTKYPNKILNNSKTAISIMFCVTAAGELLPPYVVYKADHLWSNWCANGPPGSRFNKTKSGWFDSETFEDWFNSIILPWAEQSPEPKVLIGDNLSSHLNINIISKCQEKNLRFVFLPPNSTHCTQPLDVSFFRPLKRAWKSILLDYKIRHPSANTLNKNIFPELLTTLIETIKINKAKVILSGFRATGIYPLNPNAVLTKIPEFNITSNVTTFEASLLQYFKDSRKPVAAHRKKNSKLLTRPGESVSTEDIRIVPKAKVTKKNNCNVKGRPCISELPDRAISSFKENITPNTPIIVDNNIHISKDGSLFKQNSSSLNIDYNIPTTSKNQILSNVLVKPAKTVKEESVGNNKRQRVEDSDTSISISLHDSDDSVDGPFLEPDNSDTETYISSNSVNDEDEHNIENEPDVGKYVVVKFFTHKTLKYYIGLIISYNTDERCYTIKYLRKNSRGAFSWPLADDISDVTLLDIQKVLPKPKVGRRGELKFLLDNLDIPIGKIN